MAKVICPYCSIEADKVTGREVYKRNTKPHLAKQIFYKCSQCSAYVGCHRDTDCALGTPAQPHLRRLRSHAHNRLDTLWNRKIELEKCSKAHARNAAYAWLAGKMQIVIQDCHIGMFNEEQCLEVIRHCKPFTERIWNRERRERRERKAA